MLTSNFSNIEVVQAHGTTDALACLRDACFDLVLVNRKLDQDYSDGIEVLKSIKSDPQLSDIPVMLITNYEEHQLSAMEHGAIRGFGKLELNQAETRDRLSGILG